MRAKDGILGGGGEDITREDVGDAESQEWDPDGRVRGVARPGGRGYLKDGALGP